MEFLDIIALAGMGLLVGIGWILGEDTRAPRSPDTGGKASRRSQQVASYEASGPAFR